MTSCGSPAPDDLVTCLSKALCSLAKPARIVTLSQFPVKNLMGHVFGSEAAVNLILRPDAVATGQPGFTSVDGEPASLLEVTPIRWAMTPRFIDAVTFDLVSAHHDDWIAQAAAVIVQFSFNERQSGALARAGFTRRHEILGQARATTVFLRAPVLFPLGRDRSAIAHRSRARRLVIVDPCLGVAAGHYLGYAQMLTRGAQIFDAEVIWAGHAGLDPALAPGRVGVRGCFPRCFFDLPGDQAGIVDLATELLAGWTALLAEFDGPDTHFLVHSADAHQLRAIATLVEAKRETRSVIHVNFQTSPRYMPGRMAGADVHQAIFRLRHAVQWERSLFFWAETRRLGVWLSNWLGEEIPVVPFLLASVTEPAPPVAPRDDKLTIAFLGEARPTKGFLDLPDMIDRIAASPTLTPVIKVVIQNWRPFRGDSDQHDLAVARLRRHPFVEIIDGVLTAGDYARRLAQADALLLPYDPETYNLQGSGILVEGLARGAIILVRAGTSMEDEAAHGIILNYRTPGDLVETLIGLTRDVAGGSVRAREMAARFRRFNTPEGYIATLDARARGMPRPQSSS